MKKGCFLKFIFIFTIVLAVILYIIQNKFDEFFLKPGKELAIQVLEKSWNDNLNYVQDTPEKDSLKSLLNYFSEIKTAKKLGKSSAEKIKKLLSISFEDSLIDREELSHINKIVKDELANEK